MRAQLLDGSRPAGLLDTSGPLPSRELPHTCQVPWKSSGWTNDRSASRLMEFMVLRGEVAVAGRSGGDRLWDLAERVYPDDPVVPAAEALRIRDERRLRALGIARARWPECQVEPVDVGEAGEPAVVEGVKGTWRVDSSQLGLPFSGRAALLSPFDRLIHDRKRTVELFEFDYQLEMYKPADQRRWGYFALPILYGDRLAGKLDVLAEVADGEFAQSARQWIGPFRVSFPDFRMEIVDLIAEDEKVAAHFRCSGTQLGEWLGRPASGRRFHDVDEIYIFRVSNGKLSAATGVEDGAELADHPAWWFGDGRITAGHLAVLRERSGWTVRPHLV